MSIDPRRRAKQLARKAKKRKAQLAKKSDSAASWMLASISRWPLHESYVSSLVFRIGLGTVVISRTLGNRIAAGVFLVDMGCLGVKNAFLSLCSSEEFKRLLDRLNKNGELKPAKAEYARKLIESAVEYAAGLGFKPHRDYYKAKIVFGSIDASQCHDTFTFGQHGKPFYFAGPHESPQRRLQIIDTLARRCGPEGFHYLVGIEDPDFAFEQFDDQQDELNG